MSTLRFQLIEKNVQLTDELDKQRSRSEYELSMVHDTGERAIGSASVHRRAALILAYVKSS